VKLLADTAVSVPLTVSTAAVVAVLPKETPLELPTERLLASVPTRVMVSEPAALWVTLPCCALL
jgi:hypothetical protein